MSSRSSTERSSGLTIARIAGIPIRISTSWWIFAAVIAVLFTPIFDQVVPGDSLIFPLVLSLCFVMALLIMVLVHELGHGITARIFGWKVHDITLNIWGGVTTYSDSDPSNPATPGKSLVVSLAGPLGNIVLAILGDVIAHLYGPAMHPGWLSLLSMTVYANWLIAIFNLLPGHPLDGGRIIESSVWKATGERSRGQIAAGWAGRMIAILLAGGGLWWVYGYGAQVTVTFWIILFLLVTMLWQNASAGIRQGKAELQLRALHVESVMTPIRVLSPEATVADVSYTPSSEYEAPPIFIVMDSRSPTYGGGASVTGYDAVGIVDMAAVAQVPQAHRHTVNISAVTQTQRIDVSVPISASSQGILHALSVSDGKPLLVTGTGGELHPIGIIFPQRVLDWLNRR